MRSWIVAVLVVGASAVAVDGATLYLQWEGQSGSTKNLLPRETARVEVWIDLLSGETLSGVYFSNTTTTQLGQTDVQISAAGWLAGGAGNSIQLGDGGQQVSFHAPGANLLAGPGSYLLGYQTVRAISGNANELIPISINHAFVGVLDDRGDAYNWDARFNDSIAGFVAYGDYGNPGWVGGIPGVGQPTPNPLYIRLTQSSRPDLDDDGDVDLIDLAAFEDSLAGPGVPPTFDPDADADGDGDADMADYVLFQTRFTGEMIFVGVDPCTVCVTADVDFSGFVDGLDMSEIRLISNWHQPAGSAGNPAADVDGSGLVDGGDLALVHSAACWNMAMPCE